MNEGVLTIWRDNGTIPRKPPIEICAHLENHKCWSYTGEPFCDYRLTISNRLVYYWKFKKEL